MFVIKSKVIHGKAKGSKMGFATANQDITNLKELPELGVYASIVSIDDKNYLGITNVGTRPTVDNDDKVTIETHILDYDGDLYEKTLTVTLYDKIREIKKFDSEKALFEQIEKDEQTAKSLLSNKLEKNY